MINGIRIKRVKEKKLKKCKRKVCTIQTDGGFVKHLSIARKGMPASFLWGILGLASVLIIIFFGCENGAALSDILKLCVLSIVLLLLIIFYISSQQEKVKKLPYFYPIFMLIYIGSFFLIMITKERPEITLWISGGLLTAMLFHMYLGYILTLNFIIFASFYSGLEPEFIIYLLILGTFMCLLSNYMKKISTLGYAAVVVLSMQLILIFIVNNFILKNTLTIAAFYSLISSLLSIGFSYGGYSYYGNRTGSTLKNPVPDGAAAMYDNLNETYDMEEILDLEFPLLQRLKQYSMKVYKHSLLIGELSQKAAKAVGADENKAKAGGLYHEIGRMENKEYVVRGLN